MQACDLEKSFFPMKILSDEKQREVNVGNKAWMSQRCSVFIFYNTHQQSHNSNVF